MTHFDKKEYSLTTLESGVDDPPPHCAPIRLPGRKYCAHPRLFPSPPSHYGLQSKWLQKYQQALKRVFYKFLEDKY